MELFAAQGYQQTSLRQLAIRVGVSKAAVLYHFPAKERILAALTEPLLDDMAAALERAEQAQPPAEPRWVCVEGLLDSYLANRPTLLLLREDLSILSRSPELYARFFATYTRAYHLIAGPGAALPELVRAAQAISVLGDPLFIFPDAPNAALRGIVLEGARAVLRDQPYGKAARPADRRPGRPPVLDAERLATARRLYGGGGHTVDEVAAAVGVSRATLYRHLRKT
jgi:AcrR family transcriptional regulator